MFPKTLIPLAALAVAAVPPATANAARAKPHRAASAVPVPVPVPVPEIATEPVVTRSADGMMTPLPVKLRPTTPAEAEANAVWNVRAALNIAALQCQLSPYLATVRNYNDVLRQHADEFDRARATMVAHFRRYDGTQAQNSFDRYTTQTYNSFSTLDAQTAFCEQAGLTGRIALTVRKGELGHHAVELRDPVRASLTPVAAHALLMPFTIDAEPLPPL